MREDCFVYCLEANVVLTGVSGATLSFRRDCVLDVMKGRDLCFFRVVCKTYSFLTDKTFAVKYKLSVGNLDGLKNMTLSKALCARSSSKNFAFDAPPQIGKQYINKDWPREM